MLAISKAVSLMSLQLNISFGINTGVVLCKKEFCSLVNETNGSAEKSQLQSERGRICIYMIRVEI